MCKTVQNVSRHQTCSQIDKVSNSIVLVTKNVAIDNMPTINISCFMLLKTIFGPINTDICTTFNKDSKNLKLPASENDRLKIQILFEICKYGCDLRLGCFRARKQRVHSNGSMQQHFIQLFRSALVRACVCCVHVQGGEHEQLMQYFVGGTIRDANTIRRQGQLHHQRNAGIVQL